MIFTFFGVTVEPVHDNPTSVEVNFGGINKNYGEFTFAMMKKFDLFSILTDYKRPNTAEGRLIIKHQLINTLEAIAASRMFASYQDMLKAEYVAGGFANELQ